MTAQVKDATSIAPAASQADTTKACTIVFSMGLEAGAMDISNGSDIADLPATWGWTEGVMVVDATIAGHRVERFPPVPAA